MRASFRREAHVGRAEVLGGFGVADDQGGLKCEVTYMGRLEPCDLGSLADRRLKTRISCFHTHGVCP
jgi:hypothetical protein